MAVELQKFDTSEQRIAFAAVQWGEDLSQSYVNNLVRFLRALTPQLLAQWKNSHPLLTNPALKTLSTMTHAEQAGWATSQKWNRE